MKKVGIITKMSKNYGAVLQAYALKKLIEKFNVCVEIINYNGAVGNQSYKVFSRISNLGSIRYNFKRLFHASSIRKSSFKFNRFRNDFFNLTRPYNNLEELRNDPPADDIYIVGSDQVWNPNILFSPIYFLAFGNENVIRASYAASFGNGSISEMYFEDIKKQLSNLKYISVRENNGIEILKKMGFEGNLVLDPTLMIPVDEWRNIEEKPVKFNIREYILTYFLNYNDVVRKYCVELKRKTGLPIVNICSNVWNPQLGDQELWDIGPREFLWLIDNASYVLTSSFHGTAFSIIYGKRFLSINIVKNDSRLKSILELLGLPECGVEEYSDSNIKNLLDMQTGYCTNLEINQKVSMEYAKLIIDSN